MTGVPVDGLNSGIRKQSKLLTVYLTGPESMEVLVEVVSKSYRVASQTLPERVHALLK